MGTGRGGRRAVAGARRRPGRGPRTVDGRVLGRLGGGVLRLPGRRVRPASDGSRHGPRRIAPTTPRIPGARDSGASIRPPGTVLRWADHIAAGATRVERSCGTVGRLPRRSGRDRLRSRRTGRDGPHPGKDRGAAAGLAWQMVGCRICTKAGAFQRWLERRRPASRVRVEPSRSGIARVGPLVCTGALMDGTCPHGGAAGPMVGNYVDRGQGLGGVCSSVRRARRVGGLGAPGAGRGR